MELLLVFAVVVIVLTAVLGVDLVVTATGVLPGSGDMDRDGIAGETLTAGQAVYKDADSGSATNGMWMKSDANAAGKKQVHGVALNSAGPGQAVRVQKTSLYTAGATVVIGEIYVMSANAGGIAPKADLATGHTVSIFGIGITATQIQLLCFNSGVAVP